MASSDVGICNLALDYLGTDNITSLDERNNDNATLCKRWYDLTRKALLRDLNASFSIKRAALAADSTSPLYGRTYAFDLPNDCLKILNVNSPTDVQDWQIENNKILYDTEGSLNIRYISNASIVSSFDDEFKELLAIKLALNICAKATQDLERVAFLTKILKTKYIETSTKYGTDNKVKMVSRSKFLASKLSLNEYNDTSFNGTLL